MGVPTECLNSVPMGVSMGFLCNFLSGDGGANQVDGVLSHNDEIIANLVNFLDGTSVLIHALDKQFLLGVSYTNKCALLNRGSPIIQENRFVLGDGKFNGVLHSSVVRHSHSGFSGGINSRSTHFGYDYIM